MGVCGVWVWVCEWVGVVWVWVGVGGWWGGW